MSEPGLTDAPPTLAALRSAGAQHLDPARFHYLERLSERLQAQPPAVRRILEGKLNQALADYGERFRQAQQAAGDTVARRPGARAAISAPCAPLAGLNQYIRNRTQNAAQHEANDGLGRDADAGSEMKSLRRFRETWSRIAAEDQLAQAVVRGPENAGPLNSHMLVLRSLALMRELSPDYLRRSMSHLDTLLWLDQANQQYAPTEAKPARRRKRK